MSLKNNNVQFLIEFEAIGNKDSIEKLQEIRTSLEKHNLKVKKFLRLHNLDSKQKDLEAKCIETRSIILIYQTSIYLILNT